MKRVKLLAVLAGTATLVLSSVVVATPASAAEPELRFTVERHERAALRTADQVTGDLRRAMTESRDEYLDKSARNGRVRDARSVATFADPSGTVVVAAGVGSAVDSIDVGTYRDSGDTVIAQGFAARVHESAGRPGAAAGAPAIGFAGVPTTTGYLLVNNDDVVMHPVLRNTAQYMHSYWWKYEMPEGLEQDAFNPSYRAGMDFWIYVRRGIADGQGQGIWPYNIRLVDLTVRSRPWGGTAWRINKMIDHAPTGSSGSCTDSGSIGFSYAGAGVTIPLSNCQSVNGLSNVSQPFEFGADWNGVTDQQQAVEAIASVRSVEGQIPTWADYIWAAFDVADGVQTAYRWTDTGW